MSLKGVNCVHCYSVFREVVPFLDGSGEEGLLSVAGGAVRCMEGVGCCVTSEAYFEEEAVGLIDGAFLFY